LVVRHSSLRPSQEGADRRAQHERGVRLDAAQARQCLRHRYERHAVVGAGEQLGDRGHRRRLGPLQLLQQLAAPVLQVQVAPTFAVDRPLRRRPGRQRGRQHGGQRRGAQADQRAGNTE
jgi:hypothetical protein